MNEVLLHFDRLAERWDAITSHPPERIDHVLSFVGDITGKSVIDVGSGTGVLLPHLLARVGSQGRVVALDLSPRMIDISRSKYSASNLGFVAADFLSWTPPYKPDLIVAYSCLPHFHEPMAFWRAAAAMLSTDGRVLVAHIEGRNTINSMHEKKASQVSRQLEPVTELAVLAESCGFETVAKEDNDEFYILLAKLR